MSWRNNSLVMDWGSEKEEIIDGKNVKIYESNVDYPANCVVNFPVSQMRNWKFVPLEFIPFQYNPVTKKLTLTNYIKINISFNLSMFANATSLESQNYLALDEYAPQIFKNYIELKDLYIGKPNLSWPGSTAIGYVIITTNAIKTGSSKLNAFVAHKDSLGYAVQVITENDFGSLNGQAPNHKAEKIREWLKNNYNSGIRYVLLIGNPSPYESGEGDVPMKICWPNKINSQPADSTPTDSFYSDLTGNWDLDGDGYYGELEDDYGPTGGVNFAPEVIVGRIPVYNADYASLDGILQKIMDYEKSDVKGWRKSALLPESFIAQTVDGAVLGERIKDDFLMPNGYSYWRIYQQGSGKCGTHSSYPSDQDLRAGTGVRDCWASNPKGIVCWSGHGGDTVAQVGYSAPTLDCIDGWFFMSSYCSALDNTHPSFTYQASCSNGYPETPNNLQYAILKQGGISTVAATRSSWFGGETYWNIVGSNSIFGIGYEYIKSLIRGEAGGDSLALVKVNNPLPVGNGWLQNFYDFNIYGDPSVDLGMISKPVLDNYMALLITSNSAWLTGVLTDTGNENSDVYICWGRTDGGANPNSWEHTEYIGKMGIGGFFTSIDNLIPSTKYYYRCYATNSAGTSWASSSATFTTQSPPVSPPTISNVAASGIGSSVATVGAQITNAGGANPELHICWGTSDAGTTIGSWQHNENLGVNGVGTFYRDLSPLNPSTKYYYRCYATNSAGTGWASSTANFTTQAVLNQPVYRMYHPGQTDHFYTTNYNEYNTIAPTYGYLKEGILGNIYDSSQAGTIPIYRMYHPGQTDHFYTTNYNEYNTIAPTYGYLKEGTLGNIYSSSQAGTIPLYRMYHPGQTDHFYTTNYNEYNTIAPSYGYLKEGILGYIQPAGG